MSLADRYGTFFASTSAQETWFDKENHSNEQQLLSSYKLGDAIVDGGVVVDLYQQ